MNIFAMLSNEQREEIRREIEACVERALDRKITKLEQLVKEIYERTKLLK